MIGDRRQTNKPRVKPAHGMITFHASVHDRSVSLFGNAFPSDFGIDPVWESPHAGVNLSELYWRTRIVRYRLLECRVEVAIVEEDVRVVIPSIEMTLNGFD